MTISPLVDVPGAIATLAEWFHDEWQEFDERSVAAIATQLAENLNRDSVPITFVARRGEVLLGSVSLDTTDLPPFDHLSPWLSSLYVHSPFRGEGIGFSLIRHLQSFAAARQIGPLYLWTPGSTRLYERCGWTEFATASYGGREIKLMSYA